VTPSPKARPRKRHAIRKSYHDTYGASHVGALAYTTAEVDRLLTKLKESEDTLSTPGLPGSDPNRALWTLRDRALLELALWTGIRREDLVAIRLEGLDLATGTLTFYESKKRRSRPVSLGATDGRLVQTLRRYIATLPTDRRASAWLFPGGRRDRTETRKGIAASQHHLSGRAAWTVLRAWAAATDLPLRPFHALRATCYKLCKARGWSVEQAAAHIGDTVRVAAEVYGIATPGELAEVAGARPIFA
jgi:integrase